MHRIELRLSDEESAQLDELAGILNRRRADAARVSIAGYLRSVQWAASTDVGVALIRGGVGKVAEPERPVASLTRRATPFEVETTAPMIPERIIDPIHDYAPTAEEVRQALKVKGPKRMPREVQSTSSSTLEEVRRKLAETGTMRTAEELEDPLGLGKAGE